MVLQPVGPVALSIPTKTCHFCFIGNAVVVVVFVVKTANGGCIFTHVHRQNLGHVKY